MKNVHKTGILTALISTGLFIAAFSQPFVCSDFGFPSEEMKQTTQTLNNPCQKIIENIGSTSITTALLQKLLQNSVCKNEEVVRTYTYQSLDKILGPILTPEGKLDWSSCILHEKLHQKPISSCCTVSRPIDNCLKWKVAGKLHIPLGDQWILGIIRLLFADGHVFLGALIATFSVLFPLSKVGLLLLLSIQNHKPKWYELLKSSSRWSMTDVFVVGLLMVYFRADRFAFQFHTGIGVYCFAAAALISSIGISLIQGRHLAPPKNPNYQNEF